jgi:hypothetical protein
MLKYLCGLIRRKTLESAKLGLQVGLLISVLNINLKVWGTFQQSPLL